MAVGPSGKEKTMKYTEKRGATLPLFTLGTVQLGMNYGLGDFTEKPSEEYAHSMLTRAMELGVTALDTANNYGDSERVIGSWIAKGDLPKKPYVITKIAPFDHSSEAALRKEMTRQTDACLKTLGVEKIDMLMIHNYNDYIKSKDIVRDMMETFKREGKIDKTAISVYSSDDYRVVAESGFDAVQIPINIFDQEKIEDGSIDALHDAGMIVFARSVFLQGLVFMTRETLPKEMSFCLPYLERMWELSKKFDLSPDALAASFVLSIPAIDSLVLGCQRLDQLEANCKLIDRTRQLTDEEMSLVRDAFLNIDPRVINPRLWFNHT